MLADAVGRRFRLQITDISYEQALAQEILATREVLVPGNALFPPGFGAFIMLSPRSHHHSGTHVTGPRLKRVAVENKTVDPFAKGLVPQGLEGAWMLAPFFLVGGGKSSRANNAFAIDMRGRGHAFAGFHGAAGAPKLAHR